jgi:hypothetical protein
MILLRTNKAKFAIRVWAWLLGVNKQKEVPKFTIKDNLDV